MSLPASEAHSSRNRIYRSQRNLHNLQKHLAFISEHERYQDGNTAISTITSETATTEGITIDPYSTVSLSSVQRSSAMVPSPLMENKRRFRVLEQFHSIRSPQGTLSSKSSTNHHRVRSKSLVKRHNWKLAFWIMTFIALIFASLLIFVYISYRACRDGQPSVIALLDSGKSSQYDEKPIVMEKFLNNTNEIIRSPVVDKTEDNICQKKLTSGSHIVTEFKDYDAWHESDLEPFHFWSIDFLAKEMVTVLIRISVPWGPNLAIYGRRNVVPTITQYDFAHFIKSGRAITRIKRTTSEEPLETEERDDDDSVNQLYLFNIEEELAMKSADGDMPDDFFSTAWLPADENNVESVKKSDNRSSTDDVARMGRPVRTVQRLKPKLSLKRSVYSEVGKANFTLPKHLSTGRWYISVYNDDLSTIKIGIALEKADYLPNMCLNRCSGHGSCIEDKCECDEGYTNEDCGQRICPAICSDNGKFVGGFCKCNAGWKGNLCDIPVDDCKTPDCSSHGKCINGTCNCDAGWKGEDCDIKDCIDPICSNHGKCIFGECYCKAGWNGENCSFFDHQIYQCIPRCSDHGVYNLENGTCECNQFWTGHDCSQAICNITCGAHGTCVNGQCKCNNGWYGDHCDQLSCDARCQNHGQCKNGTCICQRGWNGRYCTISGCGDNCNNHGSCVNDGEEYYCECESGWEGYDCSIQLENNCYNDEDDDGDGLIDCADIECCKEEVCVNDLLCMTSSDPDEILLRKQPASDTSSFHQRTKFLIEDNGLQSYAKLDEFSESGFWNSFVPWRTSVIRGRIFTMQGTVVGGVRVSVDQTTKFGFTLSRKDGWFDFIVNGGHAVTLQFQRSPFKPKVLTVYIPWNVFKVLPPVILELKEEFKTESSKHTKLLPIELLPYPNLKQELKLCEEHDVSVLKPQIITTWAMEKVEGDIKTMDKSKLVYLESRVLRETIHIPTSKTNLLYRSSLAPGYLSYLLIVMTGPKIPNALIKIFIHIEVEGRIFHKTMEPDVNLTYTFSWDKRNIYKQRVYGITNAKVSIGYLYATCADVMWEIFGTTLKGYEVDTSYIGGWSLDIHHHYNFHEGILQKGDGRIVFMKYEYPRILQLDMGIGMQRSITCNDCDGRALKAKLLMPVSLTSGSDGSLYVGDFNLIRRITRDGTVYTILKLRPTQLSYDYYLHMAPNDSRLYISDAEYHQIIRVLSITHISDPLYNYEIVAGSGEKCVPGDPDECGDNGLARYAKLYHPKGIAVDVDGTIYFADGTNIRAISNKGIIRTVIGHHKHQNFWKPLPCHGVVEADKVQLQWPTGLEINPLDHTLHIIDDQLILKITPDKKIKIVAGTPLHCHSFIKSDAAENIVENLNGNQKYVVRGQKSRANNTPLGYVLSMAFSYLGELYISESNSRSSSVIKVVDLDGFISEFAGQKFYHNPAIVDCECLQQNYTMNVTNYEIYDEETPEKVLAIRSDNITVSFPNGTEKGLPYQRRGCFCPNISQENVLAPNAKLIRISAMTVTPDNILHIADQGSLHIYSLSYYLPTQNLNGEYQIPFPATNELYLFNRYGQHLFTKDLHTGKTYFIFDYSRATSFGKISSVIDDTGNKLHFIRDYSNTVISIETSYDIKCQLNMSGTGMLTKFTAVGVPAIDLEYNDFNDGLLISRSGGPGTLKDGSVFLYKYDKFGRLIGITYPTGEVVNLHAKMDVNQEEIKLIVHALLSTYEMTTVNSEIITPTASYQLNVRTSKHDYQVYTFSKGYLPSNIISFKNGSFLFYSNWGEQAAYLTNQKHPLLELWSTDESEILSVLNSYVLKRDPYINNQIWHYELFGDVALMKPILRKKLTVNNETAFIIEYNPNNFTETVMNGTNNTMLYIRYNKDRMPIAWKAANTDKYVNASYDEYNRIIFWKWGQFEERFTYNNDGLLTKQTRRGGESVRYEYNTWNKLSKIWYGKEKYEYEYDENGGLRCVLTPTGTKHLFASMISVGFVKFKYTPPLPAQPIVEHYSYTGLLMEKVFSDGIKIIYRYLPTGQISKILYGNGMIDIKYASNTGLPNIIEFKEDDYQYRMELQHNNGLLTEQRINFPPVLGLGNAKFVYEYDNNFRLVSTFGRIRGHLIPVIKYSYDKSTGKKNKFGSFILYWTNKQSSYITDGSAIFVRSFNMHYQVMEYYIKIHNVNVFRVTYQYDLNNRISHQYMGVGTYKQTKNYTYDDFGRLKVVGASDPWIYDFDSDGNMISMVYRANEFVSGGYSNNSKASINFRFKYNNRGFVVENNRREKFAYNNRGYLVYAKSTNYNVYYMYDHLGRLSVRKDHYNNVTQFFYNIQNSPNLVSQVFSPKDNGIYSFVYDDRDFVISFTINRDKYYVATDQCGTPLMIFNQYGEVIREIMRSPYGHIIYDSNPYLYLPIDYCGGIIDPMTTLIHLPNGRIYDPLIGQLMTPLTDEILNRVYEPRNLPMYQFNHNDPINVRGTNYQINDERYWFENMGYDIDNLIPQLKAPASMSPLALVETDNYLGLEQVTFLSGYFYEFSRKLVNNYVSLLPLIDWNVKSKINCFIDDPMTLNHPFKNGLPHKLFQDETKKTFRTLYPASNSEPLFGHGITLSKLDDNLITVNSMPTSNIIYKDVLTSVFNNSQMLPFTLMQEPIKEDNLYFVKTDLSKAGDDKVNLRRLGSELNVTFYENRNSNDGKQVIDAHIRRSNVVLNVRYGTTLNHEKERLLREAKVNILKTAWERERNLVQRGLQTTCCEWSEQEISELKDFGFISGYDGEYNIDVQRYPELSNDPSNVKFVKVPNMQNQR